MKGKKRQIHGAFAALLAVAMVCCMTGCMQIKENITVGADGSGSIQAKVLLYKQDTIDLVKELSKISGETPTDAEITDLLTQSGLTTVTEDGAEYFSSANTQNNTAGRNFKSMKDFYDNGRDGAFPVISLGLYQLESQKDDYLSLTETSFEAAVPAMDAETVKNSVKNIYGENEFDAQSLEVIVNAYKKTRLLFTVTFAAPVSEVSSNGKLSGDKKTVTFEVPACPDQTEKLSAVCENDFTFGGVRSGMIYSNKVSYQIPDDLSAVLNGTAVKGMVTSDKSGVYELKLKNAAGTQKTFCYEVDMDAPLFSNVKSKGVYKKSGVIKISDSVSGVSKLTLDGKDILASLTPDYDKNGTAA